MSKYEVAYSDGYGNDDVIYVEADSEDEIYDWYCEEPDFYIQSVMTREDYEARLKRFESAEIHFNVHEEIRKAQYGDEESK